MGYKEHRGGKRARIDGANGYFGNNDAGNSMAGKSNTAGQHRHMGQGDNEYTFYNETHGYLTVHADSFAEAWRRARLLGYSKRNYKKR